MPTDPLTITAAGAWAWDQYGKSLTDKAASALKGRWDRFRWDDAAEKYRAKIRKLYGTMQIMGMARPVPLDDIFTDAYVLDKPTAFTRFDIEQLKRVSGLDAGAPPSSSERFNGLRLVVEKEWRTVYENGEMERVEVGRNLFILGKPGAGKTTFLKYLAIKAAEQLIDKVPIFVSLKEWADSGLELLRFIEGRFDVCDFPAAKHFAGELLSSGGALVLFDGLDEVNRDDGSRDRQTRSMNVFIEKYDRTQCVITCRIAASDYSFQPFTYVELADFTEQQISRFVGNWFRNKEGEKDEVTCNRFLTEFAKDDNKGLRDLARTPLLLTLLCLAFDETLTFPQRRVEIYEEALAALLKKWDATRRIKRDEVYQKLSPGHKENMLARIAAETFENNEYFIPQKKLESYIKDYVRNIPPHDATDAADGEAILKAIEAQHGIFVERARGIYSFSHLTFQEYFTAKYVVANSAKGTLTVLSQEYCADARWREVFLLATSMLGDACQFMAALKRGVDGLLEGDRTLRALWECAGRKSASITADPLSVRRSYLLIELYSIRVKEGPKDDHAFARAIERVINLALALEHDLARSLNIVPHFASALSRELRHDPTQPSTHISDFDFPLACAVARSFDFGLSSDLAPAPAPGFDGLAKALGALGVPSRVAAAAEWQDFADKMRALLIKHRDIGYEWNLTDKQKARLVDYLNATTLLKDCLELATMPPEEKEAMLNSLYLPPARSRGEGARGRESDLG